MKEIKNADGSRNWEANILLDNIKRLEQENAECKREILHQNDYILQLSADSEKVEWLNGDIAELKAENERLKKEIKNNKSAYQVELGTYNMECGNLLEENKQLWQTLQEIKEIAEQSNIDCIYRISVIRKILTKAEEE